MLRNIVDNKLHGLGKRLIAWWFRGTVMRGGGRVGSGLICFGMPVLFRGRARGLRIGDDVTLSSWRWANALNTGLPVRLSLLSDTATIVIGDRAGISCCTISAEVSVEIGEEAMIGAEVMIADTDFHVLDAAGRRANSAGATVGTAPVRIGKRVWIGARSTVLKGVTIGDNSIVAAGSTVVSDIPADVIAGGVPARVLRSL